MQTLEYLRGDLADLYWPCVWVGLALALLCSLLSVFVVLKRMAFIGQGVSHAAFGGIGIAAWLAAMGVGFAGTEFGRAGVVFVFCLAAALLVGAISRKGKTQADTAIGVVLVVSMALGAVLIRKFAPRNQSWESFLFGDVMSVGWADVKVAWGVAIATLLAMAWARRPMLFWAFDPPVARSMGVSERAMSGLLLTLLALATVTAMKLAGVVLATAMLVLPGAIALLLSERWGRVLWLAVVVSVLGVVGGLVVSFELDWLTGPSIVCVLGLGYGLALGWRRFMAAASGRVRS